MKHFLLCTQIVIPEQYGTDCSKQEKRTLVIFQNANSTWNWHIKFIHLSARKKFRLGTSFGRSSSQPSQTHFYQLLKQLKFCHQRREILQVVLLLVRAASAGPSAQLFRLARSWRNSFLPQQHWQQSASQAQGADMPETSVQLLSQFSTKVTFTPFTLIQAMKKPLQITHSFFVQ